MKKLLKLPLSSLFLLSLTFTGLAQAMDIPLNHCAPERDSKQYVGDVDFHAPYPRPVKFSCNYICNNNGALTKIAGVIKVTVSNAEEDAYGTVCQGVVLKKVAWGWDFDRIDSFYAYDAAAPQVKKFAFEKISSNNETERSKLLQLRSTLSTVGATFKTVPSLEFNKAGEMLMKVAMDLPQKTKELDRAIKRITEMNGKVELSNNSESLFLSQISGHARWRIPSHKFK
jgi:hypothetical protein